MIGVGLLRQAGGASLSTKMLEICAGARVIVVFGHSSRDIIIHQSRAALGNAGDVLFRRERPRKDRRTGGELVGPR